MYASSSFDLPFLSPIPPFSEVEVGDGEAGRDSPAAGRNDKATAAPS